eukprot:13255251-Alexandrium_andersonii.AAC.1
MDKEIQSQQARLVELHRLRQMRADEHKAALAVKAELFQKLKSDEEGKQDGEKEDPSMTVKKACESMTEAVRKVIPGDGELAVTDEAAVEAIGQLKNVLQNALQAMEAAAARVQGVSDPRKRSRNQLTEPPLGTEPGGKGTD